MPSNIKSLYFSNLNRRLFETCKTTSSKPYRHCRCSSDNRIGCRLGCKDGRLVAVQVQENERDWRVWTEKERPELEEIPCGYSKTLDAFHRLLLVRSWCPDRMLHMARIYVAESLGSSFIDAPMLDLEAIVNESEPRVPMICILTTCSDPSLKIETLAKLKVISLDAQCLARFLLNPLSRPKT